METEDVQMAESTSPRTVTKRNGTKQEFDKDKVFNRLKHLSQELNDEYVKFDEVVEKVANGVYDGKRMLVIIITRL